MESSYQLVVITRDKSTWVPTSVRGENDLVDLVDLGSLINDHPSSALKSYFNQLTQGGEKSFFLQNALPISDRRYFRRSWTNKNNIIRIVDFKSLGWHWSLNAYLGPLADIPTERFGVATYAVDFEGETLKLSGPALKNIWAIRAIYWSNAQIYLPLDNNQDEKIALITVGLPINLMNSYDYHGIYAVIPR